MPAEDSDRIVRNAEIIEGELANDQPDAGVVRTIKQRILIGLGSAGDNALALVLGAYAKERMKKIGIPIG
jgi:hypothetical protein